MGDAKRRKTAVERIKRGGAKPKANLSAATHGAGHAVARFMASMRQLLSRRPRR